MGKGRDGVFVTLGAVLMLLVLLILQSIVGSGLLSTKTVTSTTTVTTTSTPSGEYAQVASAYANHLLAFSSTNASAMLNDYGANASVEWTGDAAGLQGIYSGTYQISRLLDNFPGGMVNLTLSNGSPPIIGFQGSHWVIGSTMGWAGYNSYDGNINGIFSLQDTYANTGGTWLITNETWTGLDFYCPFPGCHGP